jgi:hypothetical protein
VVLWVRSYWTGYNLRYHGAPHNDRSSFIRISAHRGILFIGQISIFLMPHSAGDGEEAGWRFRTQDAVSATSRWGLVKDLWFFKFGSHDEPRSKIADASARTTKTVSGFLPSLLIQPHRQHQRRVPGMRRNHRINDYPCGLVTLLRYHLETPIPF